jgi:hypothetical protein
MARKLSPTPVLVGDLKWSMSSKLRFEPMKAPPPNPMMAMPVAIPGRSGNHFTRVETGEM